MNKRFEVSEEEKDQIRNLYLNESLGTSNEERKFCHAKNTRNLDEIVGDDEWEDYVDGIRLRRSGLNSILDRIELLKTLRMFPRISDGGENLAYSLMTDLKSYKPYNYFDETKKECNGVMDKIIELYKENEYGDELVKDIERVYHNAALSTRAKEFLKHCIEIVKN